MEAGSFAGFLVEEVVFVSSISAVDKWLTHTSSRVEEEAHDVFPAGADKLILQTNAPWFDGF